MKSRWQTLLLLLVLGLGGCSSDDPVGTPGPVTPKFKSLDKRDNVLFNLELAYNTRNFEEFQKLLDNTGAFTFFFSPTDVSEGNVQNSSWDVGQELEATARLFDRTPPEGDPRAEKITLELTYTDGENAWQEIEPSAYPGETWYQKTVEYRLDIKVGDVNYTQNEAIAAMLTVRQRAGTSIWQIVQWRDDV